MEGEHRRFSRTKDLHLQVCLNHNVESARTSGLETVHLEGGLPEFAFEDIDTGRPFLGRNLSLPLLIAPITGGGSESGRINRALAMAAETCGIGMAVGSERPMLEKKVGRESYAVRELAPTIPLLANLGLVHAKKGRDYLLEAVEAIHADALTLYVNPLHEVLQRDGEKDLMGVLDALEAVLDGFPYPVFLKEVGFGLPDRVIRWASTRNIAGVDVAGVGGTNWARIEGLLQGRDYSLFESLGRCTKDALIGGRKLLKPDQYLIASGGIRTGLDVAKSLALGAHLSAMALPFVKRADRSVEEVVQAVERLRSELLVALWYCGCRTPMELKDRFHFG